MSKNHRIFYTVNVEGVFCYGFHTFAASTILAVASANSLAAARSFLELSTSISASASERIAFTKSEVAWAKTRACRTISPVNVKISVI